MGKFLTSRRRFLTGVGWTSVGLSAFVSGCTLPAMSYRDDPTPDDASLWISLRPEGMVELVSPRVEMGQGISTAIKQIIAEEMRISIDQVSYLNPVSNRLSAVKGTVGSESIMAFGPLIAKTAAALFNELNDRAAQRYGLKAGQYSLQGTNLVTASGERFTLLDLLQPAIILSPEKIEIADPISFKTGADRRVVGKKCRHHDVISIVTGEGVIFADDISLPKMLYARLVTPPTLNMSLQDISDEALKDVEGYWGMVREEGLVAVLAENRSILDQASEKLEVKWRRNEKSLPEIEMLISLNEGEAGENEHVVFNDDLGENPEFHVDVELNVPMAAHAAMEPRTAVADYKVEPASHLRVWTGSQDISLTHQSLLKEFPLDESQVVVQGMRVGGGFGGKVFSGIERDAARLSQIAGRPVKLQWQREDEFIRGYHRPPSTHRIRASLNEAGMIENWWHEFKSGHVIFSSAYMPPWIQAATSFIADKGVKRGAVPPYIIEKRRIGFEDVRLPINTGPWRGLGAAPNCWAIETAIDLLARKGNFDPVKFRLSHLKEEQPRLYKVLKEVAKIARWNDYKATEDQSLGVACGIYKEMAYSATIAEVVRNEQGLISVRKLWSVHDCGFVVNPDLVTSQIEGNLIWGLGMALHEKLTLDGDRLSATNFDDYDWASYGDIPEMNITLINQNAPPTGAGETAIVSAAASITNAVYGLTGEPVLTLPFDQKP